MFLESARTYKNISVIRKIGSVVCYRGHGRSIYSTRKTCTKIIDINTGGMVTVVFSTSVSQNHYHPQFFLTVVGVKTAC